MKKAIFTSLVLVLFIGGCSTVQSIIKSTFPYTAIITINSGTKAGETISLTSKASSLDQIFGNQNGNDYVKDVRVSSARLDAGIPNDQSLSIFKSIKLYVVNGSGAEVMVASRKEVGENIGNNLVLDIDNSRLVDSYVKGENVKVRMEFVLRSSLTSNVSVRSAINFSALPNPK